MITRHVLTLRESGRRIHYRRCGSGPALLMVHQSPRSSAEYTALMAEWGQHFTCIAPDTPGFGQSDPIAEDADIGDFADALAEFCDAVGVGRCAAYGFHSGGVIALAAANRRPDLFSCLAIGGYALWTAEEQRLFGEQYLPEWHPTPYGEHLTWLWNRILEQSWFFPWFDLSDEARLSVAHADPARVNATIMDMLDAGNAYRTGYGAVLQAPRDIPPADHDGPPVLITAYEGDPLHAHLARLGAIPGKWSAQPVATPREQQERSLQFLRENAAPPPCPVLAEDLSEGWLALGNGLIHWRGQRGAKILTLHRPAGEMDEHSDAALAIDVPGHGKSDRADDIRAAIVEAGEKLDASRIDWPNPPRGDADRLYPDVTPDRFGSHLQRAWSAARAEAIFRPWYDASPAAALPVDPTRIAPEAIARRARARLRAGAEAARFHELLQSTEGNR